MNTEHQALSTSWMSQRTEGIGPKYKCTRTYKKGQSTLSHLTAKARMTEKAMYVENRRHGGGLSAQQGPLSTSCHSPCGKWATYHQNSPCELKTVRGCASCGVTAQACVGKGCLTEDNRNQPAMASSISVPEEPQTVADPWASDTGPRTPASGVGQGNLPFDWLPW